MTLVRLYFQFYPGAIASEQVVGFLRALTRHVPGKLLILWDNIRIHKSRLVRDFIATFGDRIDVQFLPPYAPELNPTEYIWRNLKQHEMPNFCPENPVS